MNDTRYHRSQATIWTLSKVFYTPGGPERFIEFWLVFISTASLALYFMAFESWGGGI